MTIIRTILSFIGAWLLAALATTLLGVVFQTQRLLARLNDLDAGITLGERLSMTAYDLQHFGSLYVLPILGAFLIAMLVALLVSLWLRDARPVVCAGAGLVAMLVMLLAMKQVFFGVQLVGGARETLGFALQLVAGAVGGLIFAAAFTRMQQPRR